MQKNIHSLYWIWAIARVPYGDPDSAIVKRMSMLPRCKYIKHYIADNLNHDVFRIAVDEKTS